MDYEFEEHKADYKVIIYSLISLICVCIRVFFQLNTRIYYYYYYDLRGLMHRPGKYRGLCARCVKIILSQFGND